LARISTTFDHTLADLAQLVERDETWIATAIYRQASASIASIEEAKKIVSALG